MSIMSALPASDTPMTEADYLAFERESDEKHEFFDGQIRAMTGASEAHNLVVSSTIIALGSQLRGRDCKIYPSDMKVRTPSTRSYVYPDITIVCDAARFDDEYRDILLNPTLIIEVLSPSTEADDRGKKFQRYREIPSLQEYILTAQDNPRVERFARQHNNLWQLSEARGQDGVLNLRVIGCRLALSDVYEQVRFETPDRNET